MAIFRGQRYNFSGKTGDMVVWLEKCGISRFVSCNKKAGSCIVKVRGGMDDMNQEKIGIFLKNLRKEKKITQEQLAEKLNVSGRTVSRWETGRNLPDISLLVELADFYNVDVREIIEGERKSETMNEELKDVATKMANYAETEKSKLLQWVQVIGFIGIVFITVAVILQCIQYQSGLISAGAVCATFMALIAMVIITLYVTGIIEKLIKRKGFMITVKVMSVSLLVISTLFVFRILLVFGVAWIDYLLPFKNITGIENYDKSAMIKEYSADMDSYFMVFPDDTDHMMDAEFTSSLKTGLFDTDGFFILKAKYAAEDFDREIERLSQIKCEIRYNGDSVINKIRYDENTYNYPAYIASDGFDYVYEYALIDKENHTIIYVLLSYPKYVKLKKYKDYLRKDANEYHLNNKNVLNYFTIYAHKFPGMDGWLEYSDMQ